MPVQVVHAKIEKSLHSGHPDADEDRGQIINMDMWEGEGERAEHGVDGELKEPQDAEEEPRGMEAQESGDDQEGEMAEGAWGVPTSLDPGGLGDLPTGWDAHEAGEVPGWAVQGSTSQQREGEQAGGVGALATEDQPVGIEATGGQQGEGEQPGGLEASDGQQGEGADQTVDANLQLGSTVQVMVASPDLLGMSMNDRMHVFPPRPVPGSRTGSRTGSSKQSHN